MIDHISIGVNNLKESRRFYDLVLEPLGYARLHDEESGLASGYGIDRPMFWIVWPLNENPASTGNGMHFAFVAPTRWAVDAFYKQALEIGGVDVGAPALRPEYGEHYYAAFVLDPDGHKIEAVIRLPETN